MNRRHRPPASARRVWRRIAAKIGLITWLSACIPAPVVPPLDADASGQTPAADAGTAEAAPEPTSPPAPGMDPCTYSLLHLQAIGCPPRAPESGTWADVCRNDRRHGVFGLRCINEATTRAAAVKCGVGCQ